MCVCVCAFVALCLDEGGIFDMVVRLMNNGNGGILNYTLVQAKRRLIRLIKCFVVCCCCWSLFYGAA